MSSIRMFAIALVLSVAVGWNATAKEKATPESTLTYVLTTKPAPKCFAELQGLGLGICSFINNKKGKNSGTVYLKGKKKTKFKLYSSTGKGEPDKMVVDWNCNKDYSDEIVLPAPGCKASAHTVMLNGSNRGVTTFKLKKGGVFIMLRTSKWHYGRIKLNGKMYQAAIIDTDLDNINLSGYDKLVIDLDGDGIFSISGRKIEGQLSLRSKMMILNKTYSVAFDSVSNTFSMTHCTSPGTVAIGLAPDWSNPIMSMKVCDKKGTRVLSDLKIKNNAFELPPDNYSSINLELTFKKGKAGYSLSMFSDEITVKANKTTSLALQVPTGLDPKVRISKKAIKIREGLAFGKSTGGIMPKARFLCNKKRVPAPKIAIFNGKVMIAQGSMKYG